MLELVFSKNCLRRHSKCLPCLNSAGYVGALEVVRRCCCYYGTTLLYGDRLVVKEIDRQFELTGRWTVFVPLRATIEEDCQQVLVEMGKEEAGVRGRLGE